MTSPFALLAAPCLAADWAALIEGARLAAADGYVQDAERLLTEAVSTEDGRIDPEAWYLLAHARVALADLSGARHAADRAHLYARDEGQGEQARSLVEWLDVSFGTVVLAPPRGKAVRVSIRPDVPPYDPAWVAWTAAALSPLDQPVASRLSVALPVGDWYVDDAVVHVEAGRVVERRVGRRIDPWSDVQVGLGAVVSGWTDDAPTLPSPTLRATLDLPTGPIRLGFEAAMGTSPWQLASDQTVSATRGEIGPRAVLRPWPEAAFVADLAVSVRVGNVPGIARGCAVEAGVWTCAERPSEGLVAYPSAWAVTPGLDGQVGWLDPRAPTAMGVVGSFGLGRSFGRLPAGEDAERADGNGTVPYVLVDRTWRSWVLRGGVSLLVRL